MGTVSFFIFIYCTAYHARFGAWGIGASMAYNALGRPLFVTGMMMALMPTFEGRLKVVRVFMANDVFKVIGKLTYCAYLMHYELLWTYECSINSS